MAEPDIYVRGEGGAVIGMDYPLGEGIAERLAKGHLRRVNADGSPYTGEQEEPVRPKDSAVKAEWVAYAVQAHGADPEEAEGLTKADLIELYGG